MPGTTIGISLNRGFPGSYAAMPDDIIRSRVVDPASPAIPFGAPVVLNSAAGTYSKFGAAGTMDDFAGIAIRAIKQADGYTIAQTIGEYKPMQDADVLLRGEVSVVCNVGEPTANGKVYVRTAANASIPGGVIGGLEAAADGTNTIELTNCRWVSAGKDAENVATLCILTRNVP